MTIKREIEDVREKNPRFIVCIYIPYPTFPLPIEGDERFRISKYFISHSIHVISETMERRPLNRFQRPLHGNMSL